MIGIVEEDRNLPPCQTAEPTSCARGRESLQRAVWVADWVADCLDWLVSRLQTLYWRRSFHSGLATICGEQLPATLWLSPDNPLTGCGHPHFNPWDPRSPSFAFLTPNCFAFVCSLHPARLPRAAFLFLPSFSLFLSFLHSTQTNKLKKVYLKRHHPRIIIIPQDTLVPKIYQPTFNSETVKSYLHLIPNLPKTFLIFDDDMMVGR